MTPSSENPTTTENARRIDDLEADLIRSANRNRWVIGIILSLMTVLGGALGTRLLDKVDSLTRSMVRVETKLENAARMERLLDSLDERVRELEKAPR